MSRLTPRQRRVMVACRLEGRSYGEVATSLGVSTSTVQKDLKDAMAACLGSFMAGPANDRHPRHHGPGHNRCGHHRCRA
ncbi:sigma factor-like helix-turn-helix DNA-binding protein [Tistrella bauzanensis]